MKSPILIYHQLSEKKVNNQYVINIKDFIAHLEYLYCNNYTCILIDNYYKSLFNPSFEVSENSVIITFDDGYESDYTLALPALKKFNFKGNFFITTDWIGNNGYMQHEQLRALKKEGMSVQSHSKSHLFLSELASNQIGYELSESKKSLQDIIGCEVSFLSFPGGRFNLDVIECAKDLGYSALFSSVPFTLKRYENICVIGRYGIRYINGKVNFERIMNLNILEQNWVKGAYYCKDLLKKVLGNDVYYYLWQKYIKK